VREIFTHGTVGRAPGNWCLYPDAVKISPDRQKCFLKGGVSEEIQETSQLESDVKLLILPMDLLLILNLLAYETSLLVNRVTYYEI